MARPGRRAGRQPAGQERLPARRRQRRAAAAAGVGQPGDRPDHRPAARRRGRREPRRAGRGDASPHSRPLAGQPTGHKRLMPAWPLFLHDGRHDFAAPDRRVRHPGLAWLPAEPVRHPSGAAPPARRRARRFLLLSAWGRSPAASVPRDAGAPVATHLALWPPGTHLLALWPTGPEPSQPYGPQGQNRVSLVGHRARTESPPCPAEPEPSQSAALLAVICRAISRRAARRRFPAAWAT